MHLNQRRISFINSMALIPDQFLSFQSWWQPTTDIALATENVDPAGVFSFTVFAFQQKRGGVDDDDDDDDDDH